MRQKPNAKSAVKDAMEHETLLKRVAFLLSGLFLVACGHTPEVSQYDQGIDDYVKVGELEALKDIRTRDSDSYTRLTDHYVIYKARDGEYLLYFGYPCRELRDFSRVTPDQRRDNRLRTGFDTLRGCRIDGIYAMTDAQAEEIGNMGDGR